RLTSPRIHAALTRGIRVHAQVIDVGIVPTPIVYFAQQHLQPAAAGMIKARHNPPEDNGLKIMVGAETLHGVAIADLRDDVAMLLQRGLHDPRHSTHSQDVTSAYLEYATVMLAPGNRRPRVVVDAGNGAGGPT